MSRSPIPKIGPHSGLKDAVPRYREARLYIQQWMDLYEVNQPELAERTKQKGSGTISKRLRDPSKVDLKWINMIAKALDIEPLMLFTDPRQLETEANSAKQTAIRATIDARLPSAASTARAKRR